MKFSAFLKEIFGGLMDRCSNVLLETIYLGVTDCLCLSGRTALLHAVILMAVPFMNLPAHTLSVARAIPWTTGNQVF